MRFFSSSEELGIFLHCLTVALLFVIAVVILSNYFSTDNKNFVYSPTRQVVIDEMEKSCAVIGSGLTWFKNNAPHDEYVDKARKNLRELLKSTTT